MQSPASTRSGLPSASGSDPPGLTYSQSPPGAQVPAAAWGFSSQWELLPRIRNYRIVFVQGFCSRKTIVLSQIHTSMCFTIGSFLFVGAA